MLWGQSHTFTECNQILIADKGQQPVLEIFIHSGIGNESFRPTSDSHYLIQAVFKIPFPSCGGNGAFSVHMDIIRHGKQIVACQNWQHTHVPVKIFNRQGLIEKQLMLKQKLPADHLGPAGCFVVDPGQYDRQNQSRV